MSEPDLQYPWGWVAAMSAAAVATGVGFAIAPGVGIPLACLTVGLVAWFLVSKLREGRRRRVAGQMPDLAVVEMRLRKCAKWGTVLVLLSVLTSTASIATGDGRTPVWLLVTPPLLLAVCIAWLWVFVLVILPRQRRKQEPRP